MPAESLIIRTDVTAVKLYKNFVLAGIGSTVNVFQKDTTTFLHKTNVLHSQKIYGFVPSCDGKILVYGGKQFTVICLKINVDSNRDKDVLKRYFEPLICDDWIHSVTWIDENVIALLTAHNVVQKWNTATQKLISQDVSSDNSILYSGLLLPLDDGVLVMAGTVFSEVIIHKSGEEPLHHLRGHKGVIFSISCDPKQAIIVTTSDDRSVRIWQSNIIPEFKYNTRDYWENLKFNPKYELYGHLARVMRNYISSNIIVSVGEDSSVCYWSYDGKLIKKFATHNNSCIWSVDADGEHIVTGGGDCAVIVHPLTVNNGSNEIIHLKNITPKQVIFTARNNLVILNENDNLIYYDLVDKLFNIFQLQHMSTYKLLTISSCKQLVAVADMNGKLDVFIENCKDKAKLVNIIDTKLQMCKVLSMHWAGNRYLVLCADNGRIVVLTSEMNTAEVYADFELPLCKERWLTACATDPTSNIFILGDRCGNIHVYVKGKSKPIKSFSKVHGRYGPTSIYVKDNEIFTTGRDGTIKYFDYDIKTQNYNFMASKDVDFQWVEKFIDKCEN